MNSLINKFRSLFNYFLTFLKLILKRFSGTKRIWFIATPIYGNLGDYAIAYAQYKLFEDVGLKDKIIELNRKQYERLKSFLKFFIKKDDIIIIDGGGNVGTLWIKEEYKMRDIISRFKQNPIFIFPQTAFFENTEFGKIELDKSIEIYNSHPNLTIFCRDIDTYNLFRERFINVKSFYTPDIVMYINDLNFETSSNSIIFNIREDKEGYINKEIIEQIFNELKIKEYNVVHSSTMTDKKISIKNRWRILFDKFQEYGEAKLVITDRLHGMIFSAIVGTPCIALDNVSHKVKNCYNWIKHLSYIYYCDNINEFKYNIQDIDKIISIKGKYDRSPMKDNFDLIKNNILKEYNK